MRIDDILIDSMAFSDDGATVIGDVSVHLTEDPHSTVPKARIERLACTVVHSRRIQPEAALIGQAIRQLRRLPEIRLGFARLSFAKGLKPLATVSVRDVA